MTKDAWKERETAAEDKFFQEQERQALERLKARKVLKSPISGEPMEQIALFGVNIDRCKQSGGIWLDSGELEQLLAASAAATDSTSKNELLTKVFTELFKKA